MVKKGELSYQEAGEDFLLKDTDQIRQGNTGGDVDRKGLQEALRRGNHPKYALIHEPFKRRIGPDEGSRCQQHH